MADERQTISSYYEVDHDRLDELFKEFQQLKRTDFTKAKQVFRQFKYGLQRHIIWEEEILFPLFERKTGMTRGGPTFVMRMEHRQIGAYLEAIHDKVRSQNPESDAEERALIEALLSHNRKEEQILYPMIDQTIDVSERSSVFEEMDKLPEERYSVCCRHEPNNP